MNAISHFDDVLTFIQIAQLGSFQAAAQALNISTSLASKRLSRLEAELGATLMHRSTRRLVLTETGQRYLNKVQSIPLQLEAANEEAQHLSQNMQGQLKIILPYGFDNSVKQHVLPGYMLDYPDIRLQVEVVMNPWDHIQQPFDLLVTGKQPHEHFPDTSLICRKLLDLPAGIYASREYLSKHPQPNTPQALTQHRCLSFFRGEHWPFLDQAGQTYHIKVPSAFQSNSSGLLQGMTTNHCGVCYGFDFMFQDELASGDVIKLLEHQTPKTLLEVFVFYPKTEFMPRKTRVLLDRLLATYAPYR